MSSKNNNNAKENTLNIVWVLMRRTLTAALFIVLFCMFIGNLTKTNSTASSADMAAVTENIRILSMFQNSSIEEVEAQMKEVEEIYGVLGKESSQQSLKARYASFFSGSCVIGDSLTEGLSVYGFLPSESVFSVIGASILDHDLALTAAKTYPKYAFFAYGMNDMGNFGGDAKSFASEYEKVLDEFIKVSPKTKVYVNTISTPSKEAIENNHSLKYYKIFNEAIIEMCGRKDIPYINITDILPEHPECYEGDGIHAVPDYYYYWLDKLINEAGMDS